MHNYLSMPTLTYVYNGACVCDPAQAAYGDRPVPHLVLRLGADVLPGRSWLRRLWE